MSAPRPAIRAVRTWRWPRWRPAAGSRPERLRPAAPDQRQRVERGRLLGHPAVGAERHRGHHPVAVRAPARRPDPHVTLLMQQHVMQPDPDHQQGQRRRGQVHHQQGDVRQPGIVGEAEPDGQGQRRGQRQQGRGEPAPARRRAAAPALPERRAHIARGRRGHHRDAHPAHHGLGQHGQHRGARHHVPVAQQRRQFGQGGGQGQAQRPRGPAGEPVERLAGFGPPQPRHRHGQHHEQQADRRNHDRGHQHPAGEQRRRVGGQQGIGGQRAQQQAPAHPERGASHEQERGRHREPYLQRVDLEHVDQEEQGHRERADRDHRGLEPRDRHDHQNPHGQRERHPERGPGVAGELGEQ